MSAKHTPGPWIACEGDFCESEFVITTEERRDLGVAPICEMEVCFHGEIGAEQKANARLIAAAPDLLEALQDYDDAFTVFDPSSKESRHRMRMAVIKARAAIAKAANNAK